MIYVDFQSVYSLTIMGIKIQMSLIRASIKKMLFVVSGCRLVCVDNKFSKPFKLYLGHNTVYNFINSMFEERKYCNEV